MPKTITYKCSFNSGEWSPRCFGRFDIEQYANAVGLLENFLVYQLGGAMFRPGTIYSGETKNSTTAKSNLIPFNIPPNRLMILRSVLLICVSSLIRLR